MFLFGNSGVVSSSPYDSFVSLFVNPGITSSGAAKVDVLCS